jgi:hypothetical protein
MWNWYGVKTWYRMEAKGKPSFKDEDYEADSTLIEERIVLFKARNFSEAIRKAEKEAKRYAAKVAYQNIYGQRVTLRYLDCCNAYELFDAPDVGVEVYSTTERVSKQVSDTALLNRVAPNDTDENEQWKRFKFIDGDLARTMLEAMIEHQIKNAEE